MQSGWVTTGYFDMRGYDTMAKYTWSTQHIFYRKMYKCAFSKQSRRGNKRQKRREVKALTGNSLSLPPAHQVAFKWLWLQVICSILLRYACNHQIITHHKTFSAHGSLTHFYHCCGVSFSRKFCLALYFFSLVAKKIPITPFSKVKFTENWTIYLALL